MYASFVCKVFVDDVYGSLSQTSMFAVLCTIYAVWRIACQNTASEAELCVTSRFLCRVRHAVKKIFFLIRPRVLAVVFGLTLFRLVLIADVTDYFDTLIGRSTSNRR